MPHFTVEVIQALEEKGIDQRDALSDFAASVLVPGLDIEGGTALRSGHLCVYLCTEQWIFGRRDVVVIGVWFHEVQ
jgi:hypothetical protein